MRMARVRMRMARILLTRRVLRMARVSPLVSRVMYGMHAVLMDAWVTACGQHKRPELVRITDCVSN